MRVGFLISMRVQNQLDSMLSMYEAGAEFH
jgi:hypothetical protein